MAEKKDANTLAFSMLSKLFKRKSYLIYPPAFSTIDDLETLQTGAPTLMLFSKDGILLGDTQQLGTFYYHALPALC
jgi:hypothetical protein